MFIVFMGGVVVSDPPLTSVQMLWVNLIMDTFAALALATEPPHEDLLLEKPYSRTERIVTAVMWRNIMGQAIYQAAILLAMLFGGKRIFGYEYDDTISGLPSFYIITPDGNTIPTQKTVHYTMIFNAFVFC